ncbi:MAG TPA: hypothetical protein DFS52_10165 [Myxococcales bacterium]|jgi:hypothetical protein|nr:hypothetical protein [Myxococcales bacterium]
MDRISDDCSTKLPEIDLLNEPTQSVDTSIPAATSSPAPADGQAAGVSEQKDTFETIGDTITSWFAGPQKAKRSNTPSYGPNNEPIPPKAPGSMLPANATAEERKRAMEDEKQRWNEYAADYSKYLENYREAFANCSNLDELRNLEPEPPAKQMGQIPQLIDPKAYESLVRQHDEMFGKKVDRGYELIGETSPGTVMMALKGSLKVLGMGVEIGVRLDDKGHVDSTGPKGTIENPLFDVSISPEGKIDGKVGLDLKKIPTKLGGEENFSIGFKSNGEQHMARLGDYSAEWGKDKTKLAIGLGAMGVSSFYDKKSGTFGGGISAGKSFKSADGFTYAEAKAQVELAMKGMSEEDVKRALSEWLVKPRASK